MPEAVRHDRQRRVRPCRGARSWWPPAATSCCRCSPASASRSRTTRSSLLATDRYRMALKEISWNPRRRGSDGAALVPAKVLSETAKSMTAGETRHREPRPRPRPATASSASRVTGAAGVREITTRLLDGEFPKVRHLMSVTPALTVRANTAELIAAVKSRRAGRRAQHVAADADRRRVDHPRGRHR